MNKRLLAAAAVASIFAGMSTANAASTAPQGFNVTVQLTAVCTIGAISDVAFTYTSNQAAAASSTGGNFNVTCTNQLPYTLAMDASTGSVSGLTYNLALSSTTGTGSGAAQAYQVTGTIAGSQGGNCPTPTAGVCSGTSARTLTVSY